MRSGQTFIYGLIAFLISLSSCERATEEEANPDVPLEPTLTSVQVNVFDLNCALSGCHAGSNPPQDLNLEEGQSFSETVNVPSMEVPGQLRVNPGNPDGSYLFLKIIGDPSIVGSVMPLGRPPLNDDEIETIRTWIANGAPEN